MLITINSIARGLAFVLPVFKAIFSFSVAGVFFVFNAIVFPLYRMYLKVFRKLVQVFEPAQNKFLYPFVTKYFLYFILALLLLFTATNNIYATTKPMVAGSDDHILLASIVGYTVEEEIVEENTYLERTNSTIANYLKSAIGTQQLPSYIFEDNPDAAGYEDLATATAGGAAFSKPLIASDFVPSEEVTTKRTAIEEYTVQAGDNIGSIAEKFGVSVNTILWENNLTSSSYIRPGQKLAILPTDGITYTVKSGDTISSIAVKYGIGSDKILETNGLASATTIRKGQMLVIPGARPIPTAVPRPATPTSSSGLAAIKDWLTPNDKVATSGGKLLWPANGHVITQYYSWRHTGLDIDGETGDPLYASEDGVVVAAGWGTGYGWHVDIDHQNGMKTRYAHMVKYLVKNGEKVKKGQVIGLMGSTGWSTGSHLHYEVIVNGVRKNPLTYIK